MCYKYKYLSPIYFSNPSVALNYINKLLFKTSNFITATFSTCWYKVLLRLHFKKEIKLRTIKNRSPMVAHYISWWNVENLFDTEQSPKRPVWLQNQLKHELKGWDDSVLNKKLNQLSSVIKKLNNSLGPDILGLCEVECNDVLKQLIAKLKIDNRDYALVHVEMKDPRGIDIAFIYDKIKYPEVTGIYTHELMKRSATRSIFQVEMKTNNGHSLILIGNHWPARSAGQYESEPYRMMAGETLSYWLKRIQEIRGSDMPIVVMGDFNDTPFDRSLRDYALSTLSKNKVIYGRNPYLYNLMWELMGERKGTYYFDSEPQILDQFLVTKGLLKQNSVFKLPKTSVKIECFEGMWKGRDQKPLRFSRPSKKSEYNPNGYSDHYPISMLLNEK